MTRAFRFVLTALAFTAFAQVPTATFYGTLQDPSGAPAPNAKIVMSNDLTSAREQTVSDERGEFTYAFLPPGRYTLSIEAPGFKRLEHKAIDLAPGERRRLAFTMELGNVSESVTVTAEAPVVNLTSAEQRASISTQEIRELPVARRDWTNLLSLATGVQKRGDGVALNGFGSATFAFTVDGTDASGTQEYTGFGLFNSFNAIKAVSLEAVSEVQTLKGIAPAEIGNTMAGNVNVFTKSGTNFWHGTLFENHQSNKLNARHQMTATKPRSVFNQFGGSAGGPLVRDKLFIFGVFEGYRERSFRPISGFVATREFRAQAVAAVPAYGKFFELFPLPNYGYDPQAMIGYYQGSGANSAGDNHAVVRADWYIRPAARLAARYTRSRPNSATPDIVPVNPMVYAGITDVGTLNLNYARGALSAESRLGVNKAITDRVFGVYPLGIAAISTNLGFGGAGSEIMNVDGNSISLEQVFAYTRGRHSMKFGALYTHRSTGRENIEQPSFTYTGLPDFLANIPSRAQFTFGLREFRAKLWNLGGFLQDDFKVSRRLVLNLGLRYEYFSVPTERDGRLFNRGEPFGFGPLRPGDSMYNADRNNFAPRIGFALTLDRASRTVLNGGVGVFYNPHPLFSSAIEVVRNSVDEPFRSIYSRAEALQLGIKYPMLNSQMLPIARNPNAPWSGSAISPDFPNPYSMQWSLGVQRQLMANLALETAYVANRGVKINYIREMNLPDRVTGLRPMAGFGQFRRYDPSESSHYHSWQTSLRKRFSRGLLFNAHYTWSRTISYRDVDLLLGGDRPQDNSNIRAEKAAAPHDVPHVFISDAVYELPIASLAGGDSRRTRLLAKGWQVSGVFSAGSGGVVNLSQTSSLPSARPDYVGGPTVLPDWRGTMRYLNTAAFQRVPLITASGASERPGNLGRNALRSPPSWGFNAAISKSLAFTERWRLQIRADLFNAFNRTTLTGLATNMNAANFGRFASTGGARVMQLNARLSF